MLSVFLAFALIEWGLIVLLRKEPYPRLWIAPQSREKWSVMEGRPAMEPLPKPILDHVVQGLSASGKGFDRALEVMSAVRNSFPFHGYDRADFDSTPGHLDAGLLVQLWQKKRDVKVNCGTYSHLFLRLCRHFELPARMILMSDREFKKNHVLCEIWDESIPSWVLMDPLYDAYFESQGRRLSAAEFRARIQANQPVALKRGKAALDWYCTPERLFDFFHKGLADYVLGMSRRFFPVSRFLHRAYILDENAAKRWWVRAKILHLAILGVPILFLAYVLR